MTLSESFFVPLVASDQKASLASPSVALPIQALRELPCLGSFSVIRHVRHKEGPTWLGSYSVVWLAHQALKGALWVGSYSVVQCIQHLMGQAFYCSAANAGMLGETGYCDGSTRCA